MKKKAASFYDHLGVARDATPETVRLAYRRLAHQHHPDKANGRENAVNLMALINKAYEVLSDPQQRADYDESLDAATSAPVSAHHFVPLAIGGWPWYVLCATLSVILLALGFVAVRTVAPQRVVPATFSGAPAASLPMDTLANVTPAQPWAGPAARPIPLADDPVSRLVRDGVVSTPAATNPTAAQSPTR